MIITKAFDSTSGFTEGDNDLFMNVGAHLNLRSISSLSCKKNDQD